MTLRIAVGGFMHESHSFAPLPTRYADFVQPGGFPPLTAGAALFDAVRTTSIPLAGAIEVGEAQGVTLVPLAWAFASPAGPVEDEAFERIAALICAGLSNALDEGPLDGVYLDLHGAAVAVSFPDAEGELLRRVRAIIGDLPLTISLDPHANLTRPMVDRVDALVPFRTYPHIDMRAAGGQAMRLLIARIGRGAPWARVFRQVDFWIPLPSQCTLMDPMMSVLAERMALSQQAGVAELAFCFGFPYADFADCGVAIATYADTEAAAAAAADGLAAFVNVREATFRLDIIEAEAAVAQAIRVAAAAKRPVVIADTQDNPGGGGHGDTTGLLAELIRQHAKGAVLALINDAESATACHAAGEGATLALSLGGKSDGVPLAVEATVLRLTDGKYINTGPMGRGNPSVLGPTALIEVGCVRVIVVSRKTQAYDQALFRHVGIEPSECSILALKSSVHFRADFAPWRNWCWWPPPPARWWPTRRRYPSNTSGPGSGCGQWRTPKPRLTTHLRKTSSAPPLVAFLVAGTFFMENLDGTVIATALPRMADSFGASAVSLNAGITAYLLTLAVFIPVSGWVADRFGARTVFTSAIALFTVSSVLCGLCDSLDSFIALRIVQGIGGAMMVPVGRLAVLRSTPKEGLVKAIAAITWPGLVAPLLGPPVGGFLVTYASWRWIFYLNLPLGLLAMGLAWLWVENNRPETHRPFDWTGFLTSGLGILGLMVAVELAALDVVPWGRAGLSAAIGLVMSALAIWHLRRSATPMLDLAPIRFRTFAVTVAGGSCFRVAETPSKTSPLVNRVRAMTIDPPGCDDAAFRGRT